MLLISCSNAHSISTMTTVRDNLFYVTLIWMITELGWSLAGLCPDSVPDNCTCDQYELYDRTSYLINCINTTLTYIPGDLPDLAAMRFEGNNMPILEYISHPTLSKLMLERNNIRFIKDLTFRDLHLLKYLHLSHNMIGGLSSLTFMGLYGLHALYLKNNKLYELPHHTFNGDNLPNLNILILSYCKLVTISRTAFENAESLGMLDLSNNMLTSPMDYFGHLNVNTLNLSCNHLETLAGSPFQHLGKLEKLFLAYNELHSISAQDFWLKVSNNSSIEDSKEMNSPLIEIDLSHNHISVIESSSFLSTRQLTDLDISSNNLTHLGRETLPWNSLSKLYVHSNLWSCDCDNQWLREEEIVTRWNLDRDIR